MAASRIDRFFIVSAVILLGFLLSACSSGPKQDPRLPDFPKYMPAESFLILQKRLERFRKRPRTNPPPIFDARKRNIYLRVKKAQVLARRELVIRKRRRREFRDLRNLQANLGYEAYQNRVAQAEIDQVRREGENGEKILQINRDRYTKYQQVLESKRLEQQAIQSIREQEAQKIIQRNAARIPQSPGGGVNLGPGVPVSPFSSGPPAQ